MALKFGVFFICVCFFLVVFCSAFFGSLLILHFYSAVHWFAGTFILTYWEKRVCVRERKKDDGKGNVWNALKENYPNAKYFCECVSVLCTEHLSGYYKCTYRFHIIDKNWKCRSEKWRKRENEEKKQGTFICRWNECAGCCYLSKFLLFLSFFSGSSLSLGSQTLSLQLNFYF